MEKAGLSPLQASFSCTQLQILRLLLRKPMSLPKISLKFRVC